MTKRFISIWFRYLTTDWFTIRQPALKDIPFVVSQPSHGRMVIVAANHLAETQGVFAGMVVADARAIISSLQVFDNIPDLSNRLLYKLAEWCIRFTPFVAMDLPDGLLLDVTGCSHLWGGDISYVDEINKRLRSRGYTIRTAMADTPGAAWAIARFGKNTCVIDKGLHMQALLSLPPQSLRLEADTIERLHKLGLHQVNDFIAIPRTALRRRFGQSLIQQLNRALGYEEEILQPVLPVEAYQERLTCLEPIVTITGIEIALKHLLEILCKRLQNEEKGLRTACFKCYRMDGKTEQVDIGTNRPSHNRSHLFKLFEDKLSSIEPDLGIELFVLEAPKTEDQSPLQEKIWNNTSGLENNNVTELLDRLAGKIGAQHIHRYIPDEHYWPERSIKPAASLTEKPVSVWKIDRPRPLQLLAKPERIEVTAPIPDYPPMLFRYRGKLHTIKKADGPERIEQEWWIQEGQHRDYYYVEDEEGRRYWLFRLGHYTSDKTYQWFIHGFFS
jgi:protein ImuB